MYGHTSLPFSSPAQAQAGDFTIAPDGSRLVVSPGGQLVAAEPGSAGGPDEHAQGMAAGVGVDSLIPASRTFMPGIVSQGTSAFEVEPFEEQPYVVVPRGGATSVYADGRLYEGGGTSFGDFDTTTSNAYAAVALQQQHLQQQQFQQQQLQQQQLAAYDQRGHNHEFQTRGDSSTRTSQLEMTQHVPQAHAAAAAATGGRTGVRQGKVEFSAWLQQRLVFQNCALSLTISAVLVFVFLQTLIVNYTTFNGRCMGPVLYPFYDSPRVARLPTVIPFGYGACESNLGLSVSGLTDNGVQNPLYGVSVPRQAPRCAMGNCASDKGWPSKLVKFGEVFGVTAEVDAPNPRITASVGGLDTNKIRNYSEEFRVFWAMFLHAGWRHLTFNLLTQTILLLVIEPSWGFWRCLVVWYVGGVSGNLLSAVCDPCTITVGASGAIYALAGAVIVYTMENWNQLVYPWVTLLLLLICEAVAQILNLLQWTNIDNYAHLGGCLGGLLAALATLRTVDAFRRCCSGRGRGGESASQALFPPAAAFGEKIKYKHGIVEWAVRAVALVGLVVGWVFLWLYLIDPEYYVGARAPGSLTLFGRRECSCCQIPSLVELEQNPDFQPIPPYHPIRANAGKYWCFVNRRIADYLCGKMPEMYEFENVYEKDMGRRRPGSSIRSSIGDGSSSFGEGNSNVGDGSSSGVYTL